jgi:hypothetical protein
MSGQPRGHIEIEFQGICSHFLNTVPGVPHRVVLPDATLYLTGEMVTPVVTESGKLGASDPLAYMLPPHFAQVYVVDDQGVATSIAAYVADAGISQWIGNMGLLQVGLGLQVVNACQTDLQYPDQTFAQYIPSIRPYVTDYRYSNNVVQGGRAACYVDLFRGSVGVRRFGEALHAVAWMETEGAPIVQLSTLAPPDQVPGSSLSRIYNATMLPLRTRLVVANRGFNCSDARFDFLWHLSTNETGVPRYLPQPPYGFNGSTLCDEATRNDGVNKLFALGYPCRNLNITQQDLDPIGMAQSCSNSQYP